MLDINDKLVSDMKQYLSYDENTGFFKWIKKSGPRSVIGGIAGTHTSGGYLSIYFKGVSYKAQRMAWAFIHGSCPTDKEIDHINTIRDDNRIANLRLCSRSQNMMNSNRYATNTSEVKGVSFCKEQQKWRAYITVNNRRYWIGRFETKELASKAVRNARRKIHKEFWRD
jgi:hypothetical protein